MSIAYNMLKKQNLVQRVIVFAGPLLAFVLTIYLRLNGWSINAQVVGFVTVLCAIWWVFEAIPIPITSLIPIAIFPMTGVLSGKEIGQAYGHYLVLLLMGGFIISQAMAKSGTHQRIANAMINLFGGKGKNIVFGFMLASGLLSMWISNTATTLMLLPIALAVIAECKQDQLKVPLLLGIAYSASVGGMGTPIGTPPNVAYISIYNDYFQVDTSFMDWMKMTVPLVFILLPVIGIWLTRKITVNETLMLPPSGTWRSEEIRTMVVFICIAIAWILRKEPLGGWQVWFNLPNASDADVALLGVVVLFLVPSGSNPGEKLMDWKTAIKIPWGILLLFSGGLVIASGFKAVGLSSAVGSQLSEWMHFHPFLLILFTCLAVTFLTEITSNTASTLLLLPIIAETVQASESISNASILMIPATISASCAFMLPVATAPNAIVYGSEKISISQMAREGMIINFLVAGIIATYFYFYFY